MFSVPESAFADRNWREDKLRSVGRIFAKGERDVRRINSSGAVRIAGREASLALVLADRDIYEAHRQAVLRERQACAAAAGVHSPEAAAAILSRPLPEPWQAPSGFEYLTRGVAP